MKITLLQTSFIILFGLLVLPNNLPAQEKFKNRDMFLEAEAFFMHEEWSDALPLYIQLKEKFPNNYNLDYRIGRCYLNIPYEKSKAIAYLEKAVKNISLDYKEGKFTENGASADAYFYLADAYRINNQLEKSIATYNAFKNRANPLTYDVNLINHDIESCNRAIAAKKKPADSDEVNIGSIINTRYSETNPVVSGNEDVIVYSSRLPFYNAVFYAKKINGLWSVPVNIMSELGVDDDCYPTCLSFDGSEMYLYRSNDYLGDLFVSNFVNGKWTKVRKLNKNINTEFWESHASLSSDGKTLYFTSNRTGGFGGLDIYKTERASEDNWGPAVNLGSEINSIYNEETPFIMPDNKRMFFSSFGHENIGGYDIFYSDRKDDGSWTKPINLGFPVNTTDDELFLCPVKDGTIAYLSKFDPNGFGRFDIVRLLIYTINNPRKYKVTGSVNVNGKLAQSFYLTLYDRNKRDTVLRQKITGDRISFETIPGQYDVHIYAEGFETQSHPLSITWASKDINRTLSFDLIPESEKKIIADNMVSSDITGKSVVVSDNRITGSNRNVSNKDNLKQNNLADNSGTDVINKKNTQNPDDSLKVLANTENSVTDKEISEDKSVNNQNGLFTFIAHLFSNWKFDITAGFLSLIFIFWIWAKRRKKKENQKNN